MAPKLSLRHMGMYVWDLALMSRFYQEVLGFVVTDQGAVRGHEVVFLSRDPHSHHQLVMETGRPPGRGSGYGLQQISFWVASLDDLRAMQQLVQARGDVTRLQAVDHGNSWSLYFWDPEDNRIEVYMDTPWLVEQPYLEPLDLGASDDEILAATRGHVVGKPGWMPMGEWQAQMNEKIARLHTH